MQEDIDTSLLDDIGPWTEFKQDITTYCTRTHSNILSQAVSNGRKFHRTYIDGFAAAGYNILRDGGEVVKGSALRVLESADFDRYIFVERDAERYEHLSRHCRGRQDIEVIKGDANLVLTQLVFPRIRYEEYERAFCLLDPYKETGLNWSTIVAAANTKTIDMLVHFPIMSINRSVLRRDKNFTSTQAQRLTNLWGDESWVEAAYPTGTMLLPDLYEKADNAAFVAAFCGRLKSVAGFLGVSKPIPMKNSRGNVIYYLIFASSNKKGVKVITETANMFIKIPQPYHRAPAPRAHDSAAS